MPRRPPDEVITHRLELGQYERDRLDTLLLTNVFNKVSTPLVSLLSDVSGLAAAVGIMEALGIINIRKYIQTNTPLDEWYNSVIQGLFASFDEANAALDAALEQMRDLGEWADDLTPEDIGGGLGEAIWGGVGGLTDATVGRGFRTLYVEPSLRFWAWAKTQDVPTYRGVMQGVRGVFP
jgi:hypothetical protein